MRTRKFRTVSALALLLVTEGAFAAPQLAPALLPDAAYGESFTAIADLEDGSYVLLQYIFSNVGFGDGKGACRALYVPPGQRGQSGVRQVKRDGWSYDAAGNALKVGDCSLATGADQTLFRAVTDAVTIELALRAPLAVERPPGARITKDDAYYEAEIWVPWGPAEVAIRQGSGAAQQLKGFAYLDHTRGNLAPKKIAQRWLRFRGFAEGGSVLVQIRYPAGGGRAEGWIWRQGRAEPEPLDGTIGFARQADGAPLISFAARGQPFRIEARQAIYEFRPVEAYGLLGKLARPWVGNPVNTTYRAVLQGEAGLRAGTLEFQDLSR